MIKQTLGISEKRNYEHEIVVEVESEERLDEILDSIASDRRHAPQCFDDFQTILAGFEGITVLSVAEGSDGDLDSLECDDVYAAPEDSNN
jgi:hypothetical protein